MQDFSGSPNASFGPDPMMARVSQDQAMFGQEQTVTPPGMFAGGNHPHEVGLVESYQDSFNSSLDKPKPVDPTSHNPPVALVGGITDDISGQHRPVTADTVQTLQQNNANTQSNSENVTKGNFTNKEVFNQIVHNQECDDSALSGSQIQPLSAEPAYYDVMKTNMRLEGETNQPGQMTLVPGIPVPQMPGFVSNAGQPLMVPPGNLLAANQPTFLPPTQPQPLPPPPPHLNYNNSLSKDQICPTPDPRAQLGVSAPAVVLAPEKVSVPWGWKRVFLGEQVVYFSPSGIQLKTMSEIKEYLSTEGTCKCGLNCPLSVEAAFDFDHLVGSKLPFKTSY